MTIEKTQLAIDIGNTRQKAAVFSNDGDIINIVDEPSLSLETVADLLATYHVGSSIMASVGAGRPDLEELLGQRTRFVRFSHATPLPIGMKYETPETLGLDRIANAVAAHAQFPHNHVLSIQAGTCLVMDFVTADGAYLGGSISPGIEMRFKALNMLTERLPKVEKRIPENFIGKSTEESILSGVLFGISDEINCAIERYQRQYGEIKVILTGGNSNDVLNSINFTIFATSNFVLKGLHKILIFNEKSNI